MRGNLIDIIVYSVLSVGIMTAINLAIFLYFPALFQVILPLLMFIPLLSVIITNFLISKRSLSSYGFVKGVVSVKYIVLAIVYPFIIICFAIPFAYVLGIGIDFTFSRFYAYIAEIASIANIPYELALQLFMINAIIAPAINIFFAFGEEAGWRGFLLTRLEEEFDRTTAIILSGLIWGVWHWPLILLFGYDYTYDTRFLGAFLFLVFTVILGAFFSWLRFKTGSVLIPSLAHGTFNAYIGFGTFLFETERIMGFPAGLLSILCLSLFLGLILYIDKKYSGLMAGKHSVLSTHV